MLFEDKNLLQELALDKAKLTEEQIELQSLEELKISLETVSSGLSGLVFISIWSNQKEHLIELEKPRLLEIKKLILRRVNLLGGQQKPAQVTDRLGKYMWKTITFLKWNPKRDSYTDNFVCRVKFSIIDSDLIGTPRERESIHNITITITDILLSKWHVPGGLDFGITDEMIKVALQSLEDYLTQQIKQAPIADSELEPITLSTENSPETCPYKLANILYPSKTSFIVEITDPNSQNLTANQININGNVSGSTIIIGNDNEVQSSTKKE